MNFKYKKMKYTYIDVNKKGARRLSIPPLISNLTIFNYSFASLAK